MSDPFEGFAKELGLHLIAEPLCVAPRDVLAPLASLEQHFLVTLSRRGAAPPGVRLVFLTPVKRRAKPSLRDVIWWVAGDAWVLAQAKGKVESWAGTYGYPGEAEGTVLLFEQAARQSVEMSNLVGESAMRRLLALYEAEMRE